MLGLMGTTPIGLAPRRAVAFAVALGVAVTLLSLLSVTDVVYRSPTLHVAIETAGTLIALLASTLLVGRFLRAPRLPDLVLAAALLMLAATNLCFSVVPWMLDEEPGKFDTWAPISGRLLGAAGLAAGAVMASKSVRRPRRAVVRAFGAVGAGLVLVGVGSALLAPYLPVAIEPDLPPDPSGPDLVGEPAVLVGQVLGMLLYATAAVGFVRQAERTADQLMTWLAAAATLAAFARLNYFLFPSIYSEWVYAGDFLRSAFLIVILVGTLREIAAYQLELAEMAVHRERRRIARELHDGLAQELAFISSQTRGRTTTNGAVTRRIAEAAARALDESRQAIATLARPVTASLDASVAEAAEEVARREGIDLRLELAEGLRAPDLVHDALMRIVREAIHNAAEHGGAAVATVTLAADEGLLLRVEDDGKGFGPETPNGAGFGLVSMRERAEALGGTMPLSRGRDRGMRLEVRLP